MTSASSLKPEQIELARQMRAAGESLAHICRVFGVTTELLYPVMTAEEVASAQMMLIERRQRLAIRRAERAKAKAEAEAAARREHELTRRERLTRAVTFLKRGYREQAVAALTGLPYSDVAALRARAGGGDVRRT